MLVSREVTICCEDVPFSASSFSGASMGRGGDVSLAEHVKAAGFSDQKSVS